MREADGCWQSKCQSGVAEPSVDAPAMFGRTMRWILSNSRSRQDVESKFQVARRSLCKRRCCLLFLFAYVNRQTTFLIVTVSLCMPVDEQSRCGQSLPSTCECTQVWRLANARMPVEMGQYIHWKMYITHRCPPRSRALRRSKQKPVLSTDVKARTFPTASSSRVLRILPQTRPNTGPVKSTSINNSPIPTSQRRSCRKTGRIRSRPSLPVVCWTRS